jgi:peptidyl-prolyl cis-trans isomerase A (cyclophilin A)
MTSTFRASAGVIVAIAFALGITALAQQAPQPQPSTPAILLEPSKLSGPGPDMYKVIVETSVGTFVIQVHRAWAPHGADRFYNLVKSGYYDGNRFFRVVKKFVAQFGIHGDPAVNAAWNKLFLPVDRARLSNTRGRLTFAQGTPDTRTTQVFINFGDNSKLDIDGFAPFGEIVTSMLLVERIYAEYGETPDQGLIQAAGNPYLLQVFPRLSFIRKATIEE